MISCCHDGITVLTEKMRVSLNAVVLSNIALYWYNTQGHFAFKLVLVFTKKQKKKSMRFVVSGILWHVNSHKELTSCLCWKYNFIYIFQVFKINIFTNTVYRVQSQVIKPFPDTHTHILSFTQKDKNEVSKASFLHLLGLYKHTVAKQSQSVLIDLPLRQFHCLFDCCTAVKK